MHTIHDWTDLKLIHFMYYPFCPVWSLGGLETKGKTRLRTGQMAQSFAPAPPPLLPDHPIPVTAKLCPKPRNTF
jgi:hypothetical protein